jgi:hypothetical protein
VACNSVADTNVVVSDVPAACTADPGTNPVPVTVSSPVVAPKFCATTALETAGSGFHTSSLDDPLTPGAATLTAVIVTGFVAGIVAGGVYNPAAEIVPTALEPPVIPFTCQVTAVLVSFVTVAVNWAVDPSLTWLPLLTVTCACGALGGPL